MTAGIAGVATGIVLDRGGYIEPDPTQLDAMGKQILATQSPDTLKRLLFMVTVLPAIGFALTMIPMFFNDYTGKRKEKIQQELNERHEQHETEKAEAGQWVNDPCAEATAKQRLL